MDHPTQLPTPGADVFDFDSVETVESAELRVKNPLVGNQPTPFVLTLASPIHPDRKRLEHAQQRRMQAAMVKTGRLQLDDPEERERAETEKLVACTLGWRGAAVPYSPQAARALYSDPRRLYVREQVLQALGDLELFTRASAQN